MGLFVSFNLLSIWVWDPVSEIRDSESGNQEKTYGIPDSVYLHRLHLRSKRGNLNLPCPGCTYVIFEMLTIIWANF